MSFPRYPAYKDSGVEWLGAVPEHWEVKALKRVATIQTGLAKGKEVEPEQCVEVPFLRVANVQDGFLDLEQIHTILIPEQSLDRYLLRHGDVLMNEGGDFDKLGRGAIWNGEIELCIHQNHVFAVRPHSVRPSWLNAYTSSKQANSYFISRSKQSTNLASISSSNLMELLVPVVPDDETTQILNFLDRETAKIDALIAEQQRLIELLQEKRQAVISHAVTKGLNPDTPMKDSGVEWLGEVPAHWDVCRLEHISDFASGKAHEPYVDDSGKYVIANARFVSTEGASKKYCTQNLTPANPGDILMVMSDLPNGRALARAYLVKEDDCIAVNQRVCRIRASGCSSRFLYYQLNRNPGLLWFNDGFNQTHIPNSGFTKLSVLRPPVSEQLLIANRLSDLDSEITCLIREAVQFQSLLKERRSALISAAVTGQIDVRGLVPEASAA